MDLKDKLDLIWKYSLLAIILISLVFFHGKNGKHHGYYTQGKGYSGQCPMGEHKDGHDMKDHDKHDMNNHDMMEEHEMMEEEAGD